MESFILIINDMAKLTKEQLKELEHIEPREMSDFDLFMDNFEMELHLEFLAERGLPAHTATRWCCFEKEFNRFCIERFNEWFYDIDCELDELRDGD